MTTMALSEMAQVISGKYTGYDANFSSVVTDSRHLHDGDLFVALTGPNFDAHDFLENVREKGAVAAIVNRPIDTELPLIIVDNTLVALGKLATAWRKFHDIPVIAITGSNGKTTVKEMTKSILSQCGRVMATRGNFNNDIGLPLSLLRLQDEDRFCVVEIGINRTGEMKNLSCIAEPTVAVITNAGQSHLAGFGSVSSVAAAKGEIFSGLVAEGIAIINADDDYVTTWHEQAENHSVVTFGFNNTADVVASNWDPCLQWQNNQFVNRFTLNVRPQVIDAQSNSINVELALAGHHSVVNCLAAAAAALTVGASLEDIKHGLELIQPIKGRLQPCIGHNGVVYINDTYNANPSSCSVALEVLKNCPGKRVFIFGDMAELGDESSELHTKVGSQAREAGIDLLLTVGSLSSFATAVFGKNGYHFANLDEAIEYVKTKIQAPCFVLVKGSRNEKMERLLKALDVVE